MPIIAATHITVSDYNGLSLAAKGSSGITINPPYPQTQLLRDWRSQNHEFLTQVLEEKKYLKRSIPLPVIPHDNYSSIADVVTINTDQRLWIKATAKIDDYKQSFWYMGCDKCLAHTSGQYDWNFPCNYCRLEAIAKLRAKFTVTFTDNTSQLNATIFGDLAEKILGLTAVELMEKEEKGELVDCDRINADLNARWFVIQIKKRVFTTQLGINYQYNVLTLVEATELSTQHQQHISVSSSSTAGPSTSTTDDAAKLSD